ncbi:hypothetical protein AVEN_69709-1 [Araneus ventricosus]|uniref:Uncharacterized protein n=1 Tax=Araneus ventricosus TaxID=182803 RepID=A0A4Y2UVE3_ARAVE|nr:hypothetical protein AVEN_69709-1 [Araneus ventricosus]
MVNIQLKSKLQSSYPPFIVRRGEGLNFLEISPYLENQASLSLETSHFPNKHLASNRQNRRKTISKTNVMPNSIKLNNSPIPSRLQSVFYINDELSFLDAPSTFDGAPMLSSYTFASTHRIQQFLPYI